MPYRTKWIEPEIFMIHNGIKVYHTYKDNDMDNGVSWYWYTLDVNEDEDNQFDVRDLSTYVRTEPRYEIASIWRAIADALDSGELKCPDTAT